MLLVIVFLVLQPGAGQHRDLARLGFDLVRDPHSANFVNIGHLMPGRGTGHVVETTSLTETYEAANILLRHTQNLFAEYMRHWNVSFPPPNPPPESYPTIKPPSPEDILALAPLPGFTKEGQITGKMAVQSWYHVSEGLRGQLKAASAAFTDKPQGTLTLAEYIETRTPALVISIHEYLGNHNGPLPHRDYAFEDVYLPHGKAQWWTQREHSGQFYPYYLASLWSLAADTRASAAALSDLPTNLGTTTLNLRAYYTADTIDSDLSTGLSSTSEEATDKLFAAVDWDTYNSWLHLSDYRRQKALENYHGPTFMGYPLTKRIDHDRKKRFAPLAFFASASPFIYRSGMAIAKFIHGAYSLAQIKNIRDSVNRIEKHQRLIAVQVEKNTKALYNLDKRVSILEFTASEIKFMKMADLLHTELTGLQAHISRAHNILSSVGTGKTAGAMAASYNIQQDVSRLRTLAQNRNTDLLIEKYSDLYSCQSSFLLEEDEFTLVLHVPLGRMEDLMELYSFTAPPMFINDNLMVEIKSDEHLLAVNKQSTRYASFSPQQLNSCTRVGTTYACNDGSVLRNYDHDDHEPQFSGKSIDQCLFAVYNALQREIPLRCDLNVDIPKAKIKQTSPTSFLISTLEHARGRVDCEDGHVRAFTVQGSQELQLDPSCTASILGFTMYTGDDITIQAESTKPVRFPLRTSDLFSMGPIHTASEDLEEGYMTSTDFPITLGQLTEEDQAYRRDTEWKPMIISAASSLAVMITATAITALGLNRLFSQHINIAKRLVSPAGRRFLEAVDQQLAEMAREQDVEANIATDQQPDAIARATSTGAVSYKELRDLMHALLVRPHQRQVENTQPQE